VIHHIKSGGKAEEWSRDMGKECNNSNIGIQPKNIERLE